MSISRNRIKEFAFLNEHQYKIFLRKITILKIWQLKTGRLLMYFKDYTPSYDFESMLSTVRDF